MTAKERRQMRRLRDRLEETRRQRTTAAVGGIATGAAGMALVSEYRKRPRHTAPPKPRPRPGVLRPLKVKLAARRPEKSAKEKIRDAAGTAGIVGAGVAGVAAGVTAVNAARASRHVAETAEVLNPKLRVKKLKAWGRRNLPTVAKLLKKRKIKLSRVELQNRKERRKYGIEPLDKISRTLDRIRSVDVKARKVATRFREARASRKSGGRILDGILPENIRGIVGSNGDRPKKGAAGRAESRKRFRGTATSVLGDRAGHAVSDVRDLVKEGRGPKRRRKRFWERKKNRDSAGRKIMDTGAAIAGHLFARHDLAGGGSRWDRDREKYSPFSKSNEAESRRAAGVRQRAQARAGTVTEVRRKKVLKGRGQTPALTPAEDALVARHSRYSGKIHKRIRRRVKVGAGAAGLAAAAAIISARRQKSELRRHDLSSPRERRKASKERLRSGKPDPFSKDDMALADRFLRRETVRSKNRVKATDAKLGTKLRQRAAEAETARRSSGAWRHQVRPDPAPLPRGKRYQGGAGHRAAATARRLLANKKAAGLTAAGVIAAGLVTTRRKRKDLSRRISLILLARSKKDGGIRHNPPRLSHEPQPRKRAKTPQPIISSRTQADARRATQRPSSKASPEPIRPDAKSEGLSKRRATAKLKRDAAAAAKSQAASDASTARVKADIEGRLKEQRQAATTRKRAEDAPSLQQQEYRAQKRRQSARKGVQTRTANAAAARESYRASRRPGLMKAVQRGQKRRVLRKVGTRAAVAGAGVGAVAAAVAAARSRKKRENLSRTDLGYENDWTIRNPRRRSVEVVKTGDSKRERRKKKFHERTVFKDAMIAGLAATTAGLAAGHVVRGKIRPKKAVKRKAAKKSTLPPPPKHPAKVTAGRKGYYGKRGVPREEWDV